MEYIVGVVGAKDLAVISSQENTGECWKEAEIVEKKKLLVLHMGQYFVRACI